MYKQWERECQHYCNYPEFSKADKVSNLLIEELSGSDTSSSFGIPSLDSAVSDPLSQRDIFYKKKQPSSLLNYFRTSLSLEDSYNNNNEESESEESEISSFNEDASESKEVLFQKETFLFDMLPLVDPVGWIKYASDPDPWNEKHYSFLDDDDSVKCYDGVLTPEVISTCSSNLDQLPDNKAFVLTRLHILRKGLGDISVLSGYRYFHYVDVSWNFLTSLEALNNHEYLMYLNASHNKLTTVLDITPPCFLTHVNLSCNEIKEIGQTLSTFWSLRHIDLSYNLIEKIEGLNNLKYLRYLNLSHNHIKRIENLDCANVEEFNLEYNEISECDTEGAGLHNLKHIKELKLAHNKLSCLIPFQELYSLKKLDISYNCITDLDEIICLIGLAKFYDLIMVGNSLCSITGYREYVIYKVNSLKSLDYIPINCSEHVGARILLQPDIFTRCHHLKTKVELWKQLAPQEIDAETLPYNESSLPLVVLVGTFANSKEEVAKKLVVKFPDQVYRCKKHTTMPKENNYDPENLISLSTDEFNNMIKTGQFVVHYTEIGRDEICKCIVDGKIGLIDTTLEAAMVIRSLGLFPFLVLSVMDDLEKYENQLRSHFMDWDLWSSYQPTIFEKQKLSGFKSRSSTKEEVDPINQVCEDSLNSAEPEVISQHTSKQSSYHKTTITSERDISFIKKNLRWDLEKQSSKVYEPDVEQQVQSQDQPEEHLNQVEEDGFIWTWSLDSSQSSIVPEPEENYLNMIRGRDKFVQAIVLQQELNIETHNSYPGLFVETVLTDDVESAAEKIKKTCGSILENRKNLKCSELRAKESLCAKFIEERAMSLMSDFFNVPTGISS